MAADKRPNGTIYFYGYGGKRPSGTTIRAYYGIGAPAEWLLQYQTEQRAERRLRIGAEQEERKLILAAARLGRQAISAANRVMTAELGTRNYHQHARGIWRKSRQQKPNSVSSESDQIRVLMAECVGLGQAAWEAWFHLIGHTDPAAVSTLQSECERIQCELLEHGGSDLERICVMRIVLAALEFQVVSQYALRTTQISKAHAAMLAKRQQTAGRNLGTALRALTTARRILAREAAGKPIEQRSPGELAAQKAELHSTTT